MGQTRGWWLRPLQSPSALLLLCFPEASSYRPDSICLLPSVPSSWDLGAAQMPPSWGRGGRELALVCSPSVNRVPKQGPWATQELPQRVHHPRVETDGGKRALFGKHLGMMEEIRPVPLESLPPDVGAQPLPRGKRFSRMMGETYMHRCTNKVAH